MLSVKQILNKIIFEVALKFRTCFNYDFIEIIRILKDRQKFNKKTRKLKNFLKLLKKSLVKLIKFELEKRISFVISS